MTECTTRWRRRTLPPGHTGQLTPFRLPGLLHSASAASQVPEILMSIPIHHFQMDRKTSSSHLLQLSSHSMPPTSLIGSRMQGLFEVQAVLIVQKAF